MTARARFDEAKARLLRPGITDAETDELFDLADAVAAEAAVERDREHAASHGRAELRYGRVEQRRGYLGRIVCMDCYR